MLQLILNLLKTVLMFFRVRRPLHWYLTGASTVAATDYFFPRVPHKILEIRWHSAAFAAAEDLTITKTNRNMPVNSRATYYDTILFFEEIGDTGTINMTMPFAADEGFMEEADSLVFALSANTGGDRWGIEVIYELV